MQEVPVVETKRAPYNVTTDIAGSRSVSVNAPSQTSFNNALNSLRTNGNLVGGAHTLSVTENYSEQQTAIAVGLNASYMGASVAASFAADRYNNNHSICASFIERAFTATADFGARTRRAAFFKITSPSTTPKAGLAGLHFQPEQFSRVCQIHHLRARRYFYADFNAL